jgi:8-oxo-dGTP diphosphatase
VSGSLISVTAGVIQRTGSVLACQRAPGGHHPGKWEFPGGKVEAGESLEAGLRRELQEELGIEAVVGPVLWRTRHQYAGRDPFELAFLLVPHYTCTITNRVFAALRWVPLQQLGELDFLEADREFVSRLIRHAIVLA